MTTDKKPEPTMQQDMETLEGMLAKESHPAILALAESIYEIGRTQVRIGIERDPANIARLERTRQILRKYGRAK